MSNYADYAFYTDTYKGAVIDSASFDLYSRKATQTIKLNTFNRVSDLNIPEEVKMCTCELAEYLFQKENANTDTGANIKGLTSETTGGHSVSYASPELREQAHNNKVKEIIYTWLAMTGLLYRGCC